MQLGVEVLVPYKSPDETTCYPTPSTPTAKRAVIFKHNERLTPKVDTSAASKCPAPYTTIYAKAYVVNNPELAPEATSWWGRRGGCPRLLHRHTTRKMKDRIPIKLWPANIAVPLASRVHLILSSRIGLWTPVYLDEESSRRTLGIRDGVVSFVDDKYAMKTQPDITGSAEKLTTERAGSYSNNLTLFRPTFLSYNQARTKPL